MLAEATETLASKYGDSIEDSIREDRIDEALSSLQDMVSNLAPDLKNSVLMLRRRHSQYLRDKPRNTAAKGELDSITESLLELLDQAQQSPAIARRYTSPVPSTVSSPVPTPVPSPPNGQVIPIRALQIPAEDRTAGEANPISGASRSERIRSDGASLSDATLEEQLRNHWRAYRGSRPPEETTALVCDKVAKRYRTGNFQLEELSFSMRIGQITGVVGRNASGKTTLLRMIQGEIVQDSGKLTYPSLTRDEESWPHIRRQIAYIPQFPAIWGGRLKTNLKYLAAANGSRGKRNEGLVDWHIQRYGLASYETARCKELSGGFRMRYELARALVSKPKLLVLDEPLASLDVLARQEFLKNLRAIAYSLEEPVPIIVTSQHLYEIEAIADQMIILDGGKCLFCGSLEELRVQSTLRLYELNIYASKRSIQRTLEGEGMQVLETISDGYIVGVPKEISSQNSMRLLIDKFGDGLIGVRDITGSSRRFFVDAAGRKLTEDGSQS